MHGSYIPGGKLTPTRNWRWFLGTLTGVLGIFALVLATDAIATANGGRPSDIFAATNAAPPARLSVDAGLDSGLRLLYNLKFTDARQHFVEWERQHPSDSLGPSLEAAADLFEEFYSEGMLTSEFFGDDKQMFGGVPRKPDPALEAGFNDAARRSQERARRVLSSNPRDPDALFALTLDSGMLADHASLIQKRQLESLHQLREADRNAHYLLEVAPDTDDAYLALGIANYIIGCLPGYKRAVLWMGGVHGDKALGMQQLTRVATRGHYLRPYAKLLLALAAMRENQAPLAREELTELAMEFPDNPLYARELAKRLRRSVARSRIEASRAERASLQAAPSDHKPASYYNPGTEKISAPEPLRETRPAASIHMTGWG